MMISTLYLLLIIFQFKHFLADYPLQGSYMLGKFKGGTAWIFPLLAHVGVHGLFTFCISVFFTTWYGALLLALVDMTIHFAMDRIKASPDLLGKFKALSAKEFGEMIDKQTKLDKVMMIALDMPLTGSPESTLLAVHDRAEHLNTSNILKKHNKFFWWALGFDQMIHHLTDLLVIYILVTH